MSKNIPYAVGMTYKTKGGDSVKIIHHMAETEEYPVIGIMTNEWREESLQSWRINGKFLTRASAESLHDLTPIEAVDYEAMAKQLAIALHGAVESNGATWPTNSGLEHAQLWLAEARKAGLVP